MDRIILLLAFIYISCPMQGQPSQIITPIKETAQQLFQFKQHDLAYNNIQYRLYIATPRSNNVTSHPRPVLYMLDGNGQFPMLINQIDSVDDKTPLIVGIGYPSLEAYPRERTRDYTIAIEDDNQGGGAENFYSFITERVKPYIETACEVDTSRQTLCGHSYGGLFTLFVLFNHTGAFQNYIAGSPSIWWGKGAVIPQRQPAFSNLPSSVTITLGEYEENPDMDPSRKHLSPEILAQKESRRGGIPARELAMLIADEVPQCRFILYDKKNHGSSVPPFLKEAFRIASRE